MLQHLSLSTICPIAANQLWLQLLETKIRKAPNRNRYKILTETANAIGKFPIIDYLNWLEAMSVTIAQQKQLHSDLPQPTTNNDVTIDRYKYIFVGDIHGELDPIIEVLAETKVLSDKKIKLVFLGDYTDRGMESNESLALIVILKALYWRITALTGNHEIDFLLVTSAAYQSIFYMQLILESDKAKINIDVIMKKMQYCLRNIGFEDNASETNWIARHTLQHDADTQYFLQSTISICLASFTKEHWELTTFQNKLQLLHNLKNNYIQMFNMTESRPVFVKVVDTNKTEPNCEFFFVGRNKNKEWSIYPVNFLQLTYAKSEAESNAIKDIYAAFPDLNAKIPLIKADYVATFQKIDTPDIRSLLNTQHQLPSDNFTSRDGFPLLPDNADTAYLGHNVVRASLIPIMVFYNLANIRQVVFTVHNHPKIFTLYRDALHTLPISKQQRHLMFGKSAILLPMYVVRESDGNSYLQILIEELNVFNEKSITLVNFFNYLKDYNKQRRWLPIIETSQLLPDVKIDNIVHTIGMKQAVIDLLLKMNVSEICTWIEELNKIGDFFVDGTFGAEWYNQNSIRYMNVSSYNSSSGKNSAQLANTVGFFPNPSPQPQSNTTAISGSATQIQNQDMPPNYDCQIKQLT